MVERVGARELGTRWQLRVFSESLRGGGEGETKKKG